MVSIAVLGGGISGLSCVHYLKQLGKSKVKYIFLLEKNTKFGGCIQTTRFPDGALFEHGPKTLRVGGTAGYNALALIENLNLQSRVLPITAYDQNARKNYVLYQDKLCALPKGFSSIFKKQPFLKKLPISYILNEFKTKKSSLPDESVYDFGKRRFGQDIADYFFDPLCRGITAGDARELSIRSLFPTIYEGEQKYGSVVKSVILPQERTLEMEYRPIKIIQDSLFQRWKMWTLKNGLSELIDALACSVEERGKIDLHFNAECTALKFKDGKAEVVVDGDSIKVDHVFASIPSMQLSKLIGQYSSLKDTLNSIPSIHMAVVYLEYENDLIKNPGFGFLVPSCEDSKVLGIAFDSCCFTQFNGDNKTRLTCMIGGKWFKNVVGDINTVSNDYILKIAIEAVRKHLHIDATPQRHKVVTWKNCIPQYVVGHYKKLENIDNEIAKNNLCLTLLGASYKSIGLPDCILNARHGVENYLKSM